jgi:hypothetical protein
MSGALVGVFPVGASAADTLSGTTPTSAPANPNTNTPQERTGTAASLPLPRYRLSSRRPVTGDTA